MAVIVVAESGEMFSVLKIATRCETVFVVGDDFFGSSTFYGSKRGGTDWLP
jgi:hypothetical protein